MDRIRRVVAKVAASKIKTILSQYFDGFDADTFGENVEAGNILISNLNFKTSAFQDLFSGFEITNGLLTVIILYMPVFSRKNWTGTYLCQLDKT